MSLTRLAAFLFSFSQGVTVGFGGNVNINGPGGDVCLSLSYY